MDLDNRNMNPSLFPGRTRVGKVSSVSGSTAKVKYEDVDIMSGDLKIVQPVPWVPSPGDEVLVLMDGTFNGNGYILGKI